MPKNSTLLNKIKLVEFYVRSSNRASSWPLENHLNPSLAIKSWHWPIHLKTRHFKTTTSAIFSNLKIKYSICLMLARARYVFNSINRYTFRHFLFLMQILRCIVHFVKVLHRFYEKTSASIPWCKCYYLWMFVRSLITAESKMSKFSGRL